MSIPFDGEQSSNIFYLELTDFFCLNLKLMYNYDASVTVSTCLIFSNVTVA